MYWGKHQLLLQYNYIYTKNHEILFYRWYFITNDYYYYYYQQVYYIGTVCKLYLYRKSSSYRGTFL